MKTTFVILLLALVMTACLAGELNFGILIWCGKYTSIRYAATTIKTLILFTFVINMFTCNIILTSSLVELTNVFVFDLLFFDIEKKETIFLKVPIYVKQISKRISNNSCIYWNTHSQTRRTDVITSKCRIINQ